jgi:hypothetical protein
MVLKMKKMGLDYDINGEMLNHRFRGNAVGSSGEKFFIEVGIFEWHKHMPNKDQFKIGDVVFRFDHFFRVKLGDTENDPKYSFLEIGYLGKASSKNILNAINKAIGSKYKKLELVDYLDYVTN